MSDYVNRDSHTPTLVSRQALEIERLLGLLRSLNVYANHRADCISHELWRGSECSCGYFSVMDRIHAAIAGTASDPSPARQQYCRDLSIEIPVGMDPCNCSGDCDVAKRAGAADNGAVQPSPARAYYETHEAPHCPTCGCGTADNGTSQPSPSLDDVRDAERYRWLRVRNDLSVAGVNASGPFATIFHDDDDDSVSYPGSAELDAAIDAARATDSADAEPYTAAECAACDGAGMVAPPYWSAAPGTQPDAEPCKVCNGTGTELTVSAGEGTK